MPVLREMPFLLDFIGWLLLTSLHKLNDCRREQLQKGISKDLIDVKWHRSTMVDSGWKQTINQGIDINTAIASLWEYGAYLGTNCLNRSNKT